MENLTYRQSPNLCGTTYACYQNTKVLALLFQIMDSLEPTKAFLALNLKEGRLNWRVKMMLQGTMRLTPNRHPTWVA
jgi:hypothetical protein